METEAASRRGTSRIPVLAVVEILRRFRSRYLLLALILGLAFFATFIPHLDYAYPLHVDEWVHLAASNQIIEEASVTGLSGPFAGGDEIVLNQTFEGLYHLYWAIFHEVSGIHWMTIFRFFPSVIFMITVLGVYVLAERRGFGLAAAFFASLTPTTVGILGPAFMVPMAQAITLIPLALFLAYHSRGIASYTLLLIFSVLLAAMHVPTLAVLLVLVLPFLLLSIKGDFKHALGVAAAVGLPLLLALPFGWEEVRHMVSMLFYEQDVVSYIQYPRVLYQLGSVVITLFLVGAFSMILKGKKSDYALVLGLLLLAAAQAIYYSLQHGFIVLYYRGLTVTMLLVSTIAGAGLMWLKRLNLPNAIPAKIKNSPLTERARIAAVVVVVIIVLAVAIPIRLDIGYYHMIDERDYEAFVWIAENVDDSYQRAVLEPWKATAFTAITGKFVYTRIHEFPLADDQKALDFLDNRSADTSFLVENGISVVYSRQQVDNPDLIEVARFVYLLRNTDGSE